MNLNLTYPLDLSGFSWFSSCIDFELDGAELEIFGMVISCCFCFSLRFLNSCLDQGPYGMLVSSWIPAFTDAEGSALVSTVSVASDSDSLSSFNVVDVLNFSSSSCNCVFLNCSTNKVSSKATNCDLQRGSFFIIFKRSPNRHSVGPFLGTKWCRISAGINSINLLAVLFSIFSLWNDHFNQITKKWHKNINLRYLE